MGKQSHTEATNDRLYQITWHPTSQVTHVCTTPRDDDLLDLNIPSQLEVSTLRRLAQPPPPESLLSMHVCRRCPSPTDVSFWLPKEGNSFTENNLCEVVRNVAGTLVEEVKLIDEFENPKKGLTSNCFRIVYRSMERSLTDEEINALQDQVRADMVSKLGVELR